MTLEELIAWGDRMKPDNRFTTAEKTLWINTIEASIQQEALLLPPEIQYEYETDKKTELLLKSPHDEIYRWYLMAQLSAANEEYDRYQNEMAMFNKAWETFMLWICTEISPVNKKRIRVPAVWNIARGETVTITFFCLPFTEEELAACSISVWQKGEEKLSYSKEDIYFEDDHTINLEISQEDSLKLLPGHAKIHMVASNTDGQRFEQYPANRLRIAETTIGSVI